MYMIDEVTFRKFKGIILKKSYFKMLDDDYTRIQLLLQFFISTQVSNNLLDIVPNSLKNDFKNKKRSVNLKGGC